MCAPAVDTVELSDEARAACERAHPAAGRKPGLLARAAGLVIDALGAGLVAWGEWWDGTSPEEVEKHGG